MAKKSSSKKNNWAWIISRVFDPVFLIPVLLIAAVTISVFNGLRWRFLVVLLVVDTILPAAYFIWGLKTKKFSDWDLTERRQRNSLYFFAVACHLFGLVLAFFLGKIFLFNILLVFWSLALVFAIITAFWKISTHGGVAAALVAFFNHYYGWDRGWWLVLILLLVLYARVVIKKHTWAQVLIGSALALAWVSLGLRLLGV